MRFLVLILWMIPTFSLAQTEKSEIKVCRTYDGSAYKVVPIDQECGPVVEPPKEQKEPPKEIEKPKENPKPVPVPVPKPKPKPKPKAKKCPPCKPQIQVVEKEKIVVQEKTTYKKLYLYGIAGFGQDGLKSESKPEGEQVDKYVAPIFGVGIHYNINENWGIGIQGLSNESGMITFGCSLF